MKDTIDGQQTGSLLDPETRFEIPIGSGCGIATHTMDAGRTYAFELKRG